VLTELNAVEGRRVRRGEVVARLDPRDYRNARDRAVAQSAEAQKTLKRSKALLEQKVISLSELDRAQAAFDSAQAEKRIREKALNDTVLTAPFTGVVAKRYMENHEHINSNSPIISLQDIATLQVVFRVPERVIAHRDGFGKFPIHVRFDVDKGQWFKARLHEVSTEADPATHTYEIALDLPQPEGMAILPGMTATVRIEKNGGGPGAASTSRATLVPVEAVFGGSDGGSYVWVIGKVGGSPVKTGVTLGRIYDEGQEVLAGLQAGQRIAVAGVHTLTENMKVRPMAQDAEGLDW
jgi:RND family efflux transporter MFP subunit